MAPAPSKDQYSIFSNRGRTSPSRLRICFCKCICTVNASRDYRISTHSELYHLDAECQHWLQVSFQRVPKDWLDGSKSRNVQALQRLCHDVDITPTKLCSMPLCARVRYHLCSSQLHQS
eukprot:6066796-Amphidinium_carterae.1